MQRLEKFLSKFWIITIFLLSIPASWALFVPGYYGASDDIHIAWLYEFHKTLMTGQIPPRFVPDLSFGFGYPLFNFVFPLPFYLGETFHLLGLSFVDSIKAVFFISIPLSGIFMYLLLRQFIGSSLSLIGAVLYIYTPYRAVDLYIRGAIGEIVSFMFMPLIVLSVVKLYRDKSLKWIGIGALSLASLVLSHNITAYMFFPFVGLLFILQFFSHPARWAYLVKTFSMVFLGLFVSSYFWLPALRESSLMKYDTVFNFADHFPTFLQLITPYWGYGGSVPGPGDGMSFFLGAANILILVAATFLFLLKWKKIENQKKILIAWALSAALVAIFLMNHRSVFLWINLPQLPYFQFPWRFLILTTFFIPLLLIMFDKLRIEKHFLVFALLIIVLPGLIYFRPQDFLGRKDDYFLSRYIPYPVASEEYKKTQEEYLRLPKATEKRPDVNFPLLFPIEGINRVEKLNDLRIVFEYNSDRESLINLSKYYFPGWQAKIDGKSAEVLAGKPYGQVIIQMPAGFHKAEIYFKETSFRNLLNFVSLGAFLVSLIVVLI